MTDGFQPETQQQEEVLRHTYTGGISSVVPAELEGDGNPEFVYGKKCPYCRQYARRSGSDHDEHEAQCRIEFDERATAERPLTELEKKAREAIPDVEELPTVQPHEHRGEDILPWAPNSVVAKILQNSTTRSEMGIICPADADLTPEFQNTIAMANTARVVRISDNLTKDDYGNDLYPRLRYWKDIMDNGGIGPRIRFQPSSGRPFKDSEGKACLLLDIRNIFGEIEDHAEPAKSPNTHNEVGDGEEFKCPECGLQWTSVAGNWPICIHRQDAHPQANAVLPRHVRMVRVAG
jgi:hypothetical protein